MGRRKRTGIAAWPADYELWGACDEVAFHGHLTADECAALWGDESDGELRPSVDVTHTYARSVPVSGQDWPIMVVWPCPPGPGAYPVTLAILVKVRP